MAFTKGTHGDPSGYHVNVILFGDSGLLGQEVAATCPAQVTLLGISRSSRIAGYRHQILDVQRFADVEHLIAAEKPKWLINCVAFTNVDRCEVAAEAQVLNTDFPGFLATMAQKYECRLMHVSTDGVFFNSPGSRELDPTEPVNAYAHQKLAAEQSVSGRAITVRTNFFGVRGGLAKWLTTEWANSRETTGFSDVFFSPLLNQEVAELMWELIQCDAPNEIFHLVSSDCVSKFEFARRLADALEMDVTSLLKRGLLQDVELRAVRPLNTCISNQKTVDFLGHSMPSLDASLRRYGQLLSTGVE